MDELFGREGAAGVLAGSGRAVAKSDPVIFEFDEAAVGDGDPEDVGSEILEGGAAIADRLAVDDPLLFPDISRDAEGEAESLKGMQEFGFEDPGEGFDREEEVAAGRQPGAVIGGDPTSTAGKSSCVEHSGRPTPR